MTATLKRPLLFIGGILAAVGIIAVINNRHYRDQANGGRQPSGTPSEISNSKSQISNPATGWDGSPADAPLPAIAPFNAEQAKQHQEAWAEYLKIDVDARGGSWHTYASLYRATVSDKNARGTGIVGQYL